jgi:hypothetical protein
MSGTTNQRLTALEEQNAAQQAQLDNLETRVELLEGNGGNGGETPVPPDPSGESAEGTTITPGSGSIRDVDGSTWTVTGDSKTVQLNGYNDGFTPPTAKGYYHDHSFHFMKENGSWFQWTGAAPTGRGWQACADPSSGGVTPPNPNPPSGGTIGDRTGTKARRVTEILDNFGANCFPNGQDGAGDNKGAPAHITGIKKIWGSSGFTPLMRIYADGNGAQYQIDWAKAVFAAIPNVRFTVCCTDAKSADQVVAIIKASKASGGWLHCTEGYNEPNNTQHLGGTVTTPQQCLDAQVKISDASREAGIPCMSPSCADLTGDPEFIQKYYGSAAVLEQIIAHSSIANIHNYPNSGAPNHELKNRTQGISNIYGGHTPATSEFHPLLFNNTGDEFLGAHYTAQAKLSGMFDWGQQILTWYCMWDYAGQFNKPVGLFQGYDPAKPRPEAVLMEALMALCADTGSSARSFTPGNLDLTVTGLPPAQGYSDKSGGRFGVMQRSDGVFLVAIWNEVDRASGGSTLISVRFNAGPKSKIVRYPIGNPISTSPAPQQWSNTATVELQLKAPDLQILEVHQ